MFENKTREIDNFLACIKKNAIDTIIDIRETPLSQCSPSYDRGNLYQLCESENITYHWAGRQLGLSYFGMTHSKHKSLENKKLRNYADYMGTKKFHIAATQIINLVTQKNPVLFTELGQPENCIRYLLSDYLSLHGLQVTHIISESKKYPHILHKLARRESIELIYDNV